MLLYRLCISSIRSSLKQKKYSWMWIVQTVPDGGQHYAISAGGYTKDMILTDADTESFQQELFEAIYSVSECKNMK